MTVIKKTLAVFLIFGFLGLGAATAARAEDAMQATLKDTVYGGIIGALLGSAFVLVSDKPGDHLEYIPTGAGIGMIVGAVYGFATAGGTRSFGEVENGKFSFHVPTIQRTGSYDKTVASREVVDSIGLLKVKF